jgi:peroxiredoxin
MTRQLLIIVALLALLAPRAVVADERPAIGGPAPLPAVHDLRGNTRPLKDLSGRHGLVVLFWAAWSERSVEQLLRLNDAAGELSANGIGVAAVNVDRFSLDDNEARALREKIDQLHLHVPVLVDRGLELFHAYGVITVPSTAVIDRNGKLAYFLYGYSHEQREALFDAIDSVAGVSRPRVAAEPLKAAPAAIRRLQLGRLQLQQGHVEPARSSFEVAVQADSTFADPLVELAALALDASNEASARELLDRAAALDAQNAGVRRERARLALLNASTAAERDARAALDEIASTRKDAAAAAYLGYLLWAAGDSARADAAFDRAKNISDVDPRTYLTADASSVSAAAAAWRAMTAYRREVAAARR